MVEYLLLSTPESKASRAIKARTSLHGAESTPSTNTSLSSWDSHRDLMVRGVPLAKRPASEVNCGLALGQGRVQKVFANSPVNKACRGQLATSASAD